MLLWISNTLFFKLLINVLSHNFMVKWTNHGTEQLVFIIIIKSNVSLLTSNILRHYKDPLTLWMFTNPHTPRVSNFRIHYHLWNRPVAIVQIQAHRAYKGSQAEFRILVAPHGKPTTRIIIIQFLFMVVPSVISVGSVNLRSASNNLYLTVVPYGSLILG